MKPLTNTIVTDSLTKTDSLRILIASSHFYLPQVYGGLQTATHELALALKERGHSVATLFAIEKKGRIGFLGRISAKLRLPYIRDAAFGYDCFRAWGPVGAVASVVWRFRPNCVIVQSPAGMPLALELDRLKIPVVFYFHNVEHGLLGGDPRTLKTKSFISNSEYTASSIRETYGLESVVVPPYISKKISTVATHSIEPYVLFVNPINEKGLKIASAIASLLPHIPFRFIKAWSFDHDRVVNLKSAIRGLKNVIVKRSQRQMNNVYGSARLVLVPSIWKEAWGRVASEAQDFGIPVVSSNIGGLVEAVGAGGILIDPQAPIEVWVEAINDLWTSKPLYDNLAKQAQQHAARPSISADTQITKILFVLSSAIRHLEADTNGMIS